jgi:hypothetical protein
MVQMAGSNKYSFNMPVSGLAMASLRHGRDNFTTATLGLDAGHRLMALSIDTTCSMGAYLSAFAPYIPHVGAVMLP